MKKYDAIVIGAGNGGLIAATTLAKLNKKVLLLEKHNVPGGFASSFVRGRFEFEPALHELCDHGTKKNPGFVYKLFEELGINVDWCEVPEAYRLIGTFEGKKIDVTFPFGEENFINTCEKYDPNSKNSVRKFIDICLELKNAIKYIDEAKGLPDTKVLKKYFPNYLTTGSYTLKQVMEGLKIPKLSQKFLEAYWTYLGSPSDEISFILYGIMFIEYIKFGAQIPSQRSHEISQAIANRFQELGGEIWFNTEALEILVENNKVKGVLTNNGIVYSNHIISNASPHIVYGKLIKSNLIPEHDKKLTNWRKPGSQGYSVYLGLNKSIEELGLNDYSYFMYSDIDSSAQNKMCKNLKENMIYIVVALNAANKNASEKGTSILSFTTIYSGQKAWDNLDEENYFKVKNAIADRFISDFENKMKINIRNHIEEIEVATPMTFARYTGSINGSIYGYACNVNDSTLIRGQLMDKEDSIVGLRFCGGNGFRAHGYSTTYLSGKTMGLKTLQDMSMFKN